MWDSVIKMAAGSCIDLNVRSGEMDMRLNRLALKFLFPQVILVNVVIGYVCKRSFVGASDT